MSLTKHEEGSLRELWSIALPLMLTSLSAMSMIFADRWMLAHYSYEAHNAAVGATTLGWSFIFGWMILASISEVFVAQYNGAGKFSRLGEPVWQLMWVSLASVVFFLPMSLWGTELIFGSGVESQFERQYFQIMVAFGPFFALYTALAGFFIGQGKTKLVTLVVVVANLFNILLDYALIFGVEGLFAPLGVTGAALATSMATMFEFGILFFFFLRPANRKEYGAASWQVNWPAMKDCVRVGLPTALFVMVELLAYAVFYALMKQKGPLYITVMGIGQSMLILFFFFAEGINKATATVVGNLIGAKRAHAVSNVVKSGVYLNLIFLVFLMIVFTLGMPLIVDQFLPHAEEEFLQQVRDPLRISLIFVALYIFFEGLRMQFAGVLTAAGDTIFLMVAGVFSIWVLMLLPAYILVMKFDASVEVASLIWTIYSALACAIYYLRIQTGKWQSISISSDSVSA